VQSAIQAEGKESAAGWQASGALREAECGNREEARRQSAAALTLSAGRNVQTIAALALAGANDAARAQAIVTELQEKFPSDTMLQSYWLPTIRAAIELDRKNPSGALERLQGAASYDLGADGSLYPAYVRGQAFLMMHQGSAAAAEFYKIIKHPGIVWNSTTGALAKLGLARAYALQGDSAKARAAYLDFLNLWKDADPDIPILKQAKAEYARLN
jgi:predicted Zn-dependent protease